MLCHHLAGGRRSVSAANGALHSQIEVPHFRIGLEGVLLPARTENFNWNHLKIVSI
jgi:hypothetical protein